MSKELVISRLPRTAGRDSQEGQVSRIYIEREKEFRARRQHLQRKSHPASSQACSPPSWTLARRRRLLYVRTFSKPRGYDHGHPHEAAANLRGFTTSR